MNSDIFDFKRFGLYTRQQFRDNWKMYSFALLGIMAVYLWAFYQTFRDYKTNFTEHMFRNDELDFGTSVSFLSITTMLAFIVAAESFKYFAIKTQAIHYLTLPVSTLERFVYPLLVLLPLAAAISWVVWYVGDLATFSMLKAQFPQISRGKITHDENFEYIFSVLFLGGCLVFMLGAVALGRFHFFKTLGILIVLGLIMSWLSWRFLSYYFPNYEINVAPVPWLRPRATFGNDIMGDTSQFSLVHDPNEWLAHFWWIYAVPVLLLAATYLKMKEKQV